MSTTLSDQDWRQLLVTLERRGGAVRISGTSEENPGAFGPGYQTRLLGVDSLGLVFQLPGRPGAVKYFRPGSVTEVLVADENQHWQFVSVVQGLVSYRLNARTEVQAVRIDDPYEVHRVQRREYYRVACAGSNVAPVLVEPLVVDVPGAPGTGPRVERSKAPGGPAHAAIATVPGRQIAAWRPGHHTVTLRAGERVDRRQGFQAKLINIGGGGMGLLAPPESIEVINSTDRFQCTLALPMLDDPLVLVVHCVHRKPIPNGTHVLGMRLQIDDRWEERWCADQLMKCSAWLQRQHLRRRRRDRRRHRSRGLH